MTDLKNKVNKAKLFRELTEFGKKRFEFTCEPDEDLKVFLDGAETLFKLLRLPVVVKSFYCENQKMKYRDEICLRQCGNCKNIGKQQ